MAEHDRRHAEKAFQRAEEMFLVGNIRGAQRQATTARRLCPSLALATNALDAYDVHAAAAAGNWRAVLGIAPGAGAGDLTHADVRKRFRRLSVLVHPDRNRSAAAAGAFRLLLQAYDAVSAGTDGPPRPWWMEQVRERQQQRRPDVRHRHPLPARWKEPPCKFKVIYCRFCKEEFARPCGDLEERAGMMCEDCHRWIRPPWEKKPAEPADPATTKKQSDAGDAAAPTPRPPPRKAAVFPCPAQCPECGERYASNVSVGKWCLRCKACGKCSLFDVQGPDLATATKSGRAPAS